MVKIEWMNGWYNGYLILDYAAAEEINITKAKKIIKLAEQCEVLDDLLTNIEEAIINSLAEGCNLQVRSDLFGSQRKALIKRNETKIKKLKQIKQLIKERM